MGSRDPQVGHPRRLTRPGAIALASLLAACAGTPRPDAAVVERPGAGVVRSLAPTGKLRVGVYPGSPTSMVRDKASGEARGLSYELGRELAARLGVPFEPVEYPRVAEVVEAIKARQVDFTVTNATPARAKDIDFTAPILALELGYLAPRGSGIAAADDVDRPGIRVGVTQGSTSQATLSRTLKSAKLVAAPTVKAAVELLANGGIDVYATNKALLSEMADQLPGSSILEGRWGLEHMAIGYPKGRDAGAAYLSRFAEAAQSEGLVRRAAQRAGLRGAAQP
jgi:polar amino acid transport system substrate-binding protein